MNNTTIKHETQAFSKYYKSLEIREKKKIKSYVMKKSGIKRDSFFAYVSGRRNPRPYVKK